MRRSLIALLADPKTKGPLRLDVSRAEPGGNILEGSLSSSCGNRFSISDGIPRFVTTEDSDQRQTERSFGFKWRRRDTYDSPAVHTFFGQWLAQRYGFGDCAEMGRYMAGRGCVLDAGCGSGLSASQWLGADWAGEAWVGVDISEAIDVAKQRLGQVPNTHFIQADILDPPLIERGFDAIFSEGVLHHTPSTEQAIKRLAPLLKPEGEFLFYVYRRKGPIREFADDFIRGEVSGLEPEQAWEKLRPLTRLAQALADLKVTIDVPEDIPYLGIKAGPVDVQRLIYWNFMKLFWNREFSFEENNHVNYDWYHPRYAHRQSEEEVRRWCAEAGLRVHHFNAQESGFTVRAFKS